MSFSEYTEIKCNYKHTCPDFFKSLYKGSCVKIKSSQKTFQVVGINPNSKICWIREWPFALEVNKTFSLEINQITTQTFCSNSFTDK